MPISRREFLLEGVKVSAAFLAAEALGPRLLAHEGGAPPYRRPPLDKISLTEAPAIDYSLMVVAAYLMQYEPPPAHAPAGGAWEASYDLIEWDGSAMGEKFFRRNRVLGHLAVKRRPDAAGVAYEVEQAVRLNRFESGFRSTMRCAAGPLPSLLDWQTDFRSRRAGLFGAAPLGLGERGRHEGGVLETASAAGTRRIPTRRPVVPQWAVLDALRRARADRSDPLAAVEFDLLHDLTSYRPRQRLAPYGTLVLGLGGREHTLHGFLQTGAGAEPTNIWVDAAGRPLLATGGLLSMAMTS